MEEQPKDYEIQSFEELLAEEYKNLNKFQRGIYHIQDYVLVYIFAAFAAGYLAGLFVGN